MSENKPETFSVFYDPDKNTVDLADIITLPTAMTEEERVVQSMRDFRSTRPKEVRYSNAITSGPTELPTSVLSAAAIQVADRTGPQQITVRLYCGHLRIMDFANEEQANETMKVLKLAIGGK